MGLFRHCRTTFFIRNAVTFITLLLVPAFYSIFVLDLKSIKWETAESEQDIIETEPAGVVPQVAFTRI